VAVFGCEGVDASDICMLAKRSGADEIVLVGRCNRIVADVVNRLQAEDGSDKFGRVFAGSFDEAATADLAVIAGGSDSEPTAARSNSLRTIAENVRRYIHELMVSGFDGVLVVAVYPTDLMTQVAQAESGLPARRVIGIGLEGNDWNSTHGTVGDTVWCSTICSQVGFFDDCDPQCPHFVASNAERFPSRSNSIHTRGLATCVTNICEAILHERDQVYPVSAMVEEPSDIKGTYVTLLCRLGRDGVRAIIGPSQRSNKNPELKTDAEQQRSLSQKLFKKDGPFKAQVNVNGRLWE
jgi:L-lactate dehydrogenase